MATAHPPTSPTGGGGGDGANVTRPGAPSRLRARWRQARSLIRLSPFDTGTPGGRSDERYRRIALTTLSSLASRGVGAVVGLVTVPLVLGHLGKERFGLWSTITPLVAWVAIFDFGIANGLVNAISRAHGLDDEEEARRSVATALVLLLGLAAAIVVLIAVAAPLVNWSSLLAVRGAVEEGTVRWSVVAAMATFVVGMPLSIVPQVYAGYQRAYVANACALVGTLAGLAALLLALHGGAGMPVLVVVLGVGGILSSAMGLAVIFVTMPWLRFRVSAVSRDSARRLMSRSVPLFLFQLGALVVNETQSIVLAHRCDLSVVADYAIVMRLYALVVGLIQASTASFVPSFREASERGETPWVRSAFTHFVRARLLLAMGAGFALLLAGNVLLKWWLRRSDVAFGSASWIALAILLVATTWVTAHSDLLAIMDTLWALVALVLVNGAVTLALTYALAPRFQVLGAVLATATVTVLLYSWLVPWLVRVLYFQRS